MQAPAVCDGAGQRSKTCHHKTYIPMVYWLKCQDKIEVHGFEFQLTPFTFVILLLVNI